MVYRGSRAHFCASISIRPCEPQPQTFQSHIGMIIWSVQTPHRLRRAIPARGTKYTHACTRIEAQNQFRDCWSWIFFYTMNENVTVSNRERSVLCEIPDPRDQWQMSLSKFSTQNQANCSNCKHWPKYRTNRKRGSNKSKVMWRTAREGAS